MVIGSLDVGSWVDIPSTLTICDDRTVRCCEPLALGRRAGLLHGGCVVGPSGRGRPVLGGPQRTPFSSARALGMSA